MGKSQIKRKTFAHCVWERKENATTIFLNFIYSLNTIFIELKGIKGRGAVGGGTGWSDPEVLCSIR